MAKSILGVVNDKGGASKTTTVISLGTALHRMGKRVVLVDADSMGTLSKWRELSPEDADLPAVVKLDTPSVLAAGIKAIDAEVIIVDSPPKTDEVAAKIIGLANAVLIPMQHSPADIWALTNTVKMVQTKLNMGVEMPVAFLITRAKQATSLAKYVQGGEWNGYGFPIINGSIPERIIFQEMLFNGSTVHDSNETDLKQAIDNIAQELIQRKMV